MSNLLLIKAIFRCVYYSFEETKSDTSCLLTASSTYDKRQIPFGISYHLLLKRKVNRFISFKHSTSMRNILYRLSKLDVFLFVFTQGILKKVSRLWYSKVTFLFNACAY